MATGSQSLESLRGAVEVAEGDATTPTRLLYLPKGALTFARAKEPIAVELAWNQQDAVQDILAGMSDVPVSVTSAPTSAEDLGWFLCAFDGAFGPAGSLSDTTAYTRTGLPSQTDNTVSATGTRSIHLQYAPSDLLATYGMSFPGLVGESLTIDFARRASGADTGMRWSGTFRTASAGVPITAFTGTPSSRAQTWMLGNLTRTYLDTSTMGSTADTNIVSGSFNLSRPASFHDGFDSGIAGAHTSMHRAAGWDTTLTLLRKFSDMTEYNAYHGSAGVKTLRKFRLLSENGLAGAATVKNTVRLDFVGKHVALSEPEWNDGLYYATHTLRGMYDATLGASWKVITINSIAAAYTTA